MTLDTTRGLKNLLNYRFYDPVNFLRRGLGIPQNIHGAGWLDTKPIKIHAIEKVEEPTKISEGDDKSWICAFRSKTGLGQNEQMAIG